MEPCIIGGESKQEGICYPKQDRYLENQFVIIFKTTEQILVLVRGQEISAKCLGQVYDQEGNLQSIYLGQVNDQEGIFKTTVPWSSE